MHPDVSYLNISYFRENAVNIRVARAIVRKPHVTLWPEGLGHPWLTASCISLVGALATISLLNYGAGSCFVCNTS